MKLYTELLYCTVTLQSLDVHVYVTVQWATVLYNYPPDLEVLVYKTVHWATVLYRYPL